MTRLRILPLVLVYSWQCYVSAVAWFELTMILVRTSMLQDMYCSIGMDLDV